MTRYAWGAVLLAAFVAVLLGGCKQSAQRQSQEAPPLHTTQPCDPLLRRVRRCRLLPTAARDDDRRHPDQSGQTDRSSRPAHLQIAEAVLRRLTSDSRGKAGVVVA